MRARAYAEGYLPSAVSEAVQRNYDLITLDLRIPGLDGLEIARLFGRVVVAVAASPTKAPTFPVEERVALAAEVLARDGADRRRRPLSSTLFCGGWERPWARKAVFSWKPFC